MASKKSVKTETKPVVAREEEEEDLEIEPDDEPVPAPQKKKTADKKRAEPEPDAVPAAAAAPAPKKKAPAKKAKKEPSPEPEEEEEDEEEPVAAPVAAVVPKKKRGPIKISNKNVAKGDRLSTVSPYKFESSRKTPGKARAGEAAKRESKYLQTANGLLLRRAQVKRVAKQASAAAIDMLEREAAPQIARLRARGKPVPTNLTISSNKQNRSFSEDAIALLSIIADNDLNCKFALANKFRIANGSRDTLFPVDYEHAVEVLSGNY